MVSCLIAVANMFSNRVLLLNENHCLCLGAVNFVGLIDYQVFTMKLPFGEMILEQISPYFGHY